MHNGILILGNLYTYLVIYLLEINHSWIGKYTGLVPWESYGVLQLQESQTGRKWFMQIFMFISPKNYTYPNFHSTYNGFLHPKVEKGWPSKTNPVIFADS